MSSVYIIGQRRQTIGFMGVGVVPVDVDDAASALAALRRVAADPDAPLVLVFESLVTDDPAAFEEVQNHSRNTILVIPDHLGGHGLMYRVIRDEIEKSIGVDLLGKEARSAEA